MIIAGVWYLKGELDKSESRVESLRREVEGKFGVVDEKFNRTNQTVEEKFKVADEKIAKSMETAVKVSSENFFKYNYSTEHARLHGKAITLLLQLHDRVQIIMLNDRISLI